MAHGVVVGLRPPHVSRLHRERARSDFSAHSSSRASLGTPRTTKGFALHHTTRTRLPRRTATNASGRKSRQNMKKKRRGQETKRTSTCFRKELLLSRPYADTALSPAVSRRLLLPAKPKRVRWWAEGERVCGEHAREAAALRNSLVSSSNGNRCKHCGVA